MAKPKKDPMDPSFQAEAVVGAGRGALIVAMFGAGWLGWGLSVARAFTGLVDAVFGLVELFLLACSIHAIQNGRKLRSHGWNGNPALGRVRLRLVSRPQNRLVAWLTVSFPQVSAAP